MTRYVVKILKSSICIYFILYIFLAEELSSIIKKYNEVALIHESIIAQEAPTIFYLFFTDDCYFFLFYLFLLMIVTFSSKARTLKL